ncbi:MAG: GerMN domain-containing protein [Ilumatobacteraceae bacterium]
MRRLLALTSVGLLVVVLAACGLPTDGDFSRIDPSEDGFGLSQTTLPTTTTTTTTVPTTTVPESTTTSSSILQTTTTTLPVELVTVFYPSGRQLAQAQQALPLNPSLQQVMFLILSGHPEGVEYVGMRDILPSDADITVEKIGGVAVVDFPPGLFDDISPTDQLLVFGQIVLTMTNQRGVGQVRFEQDGGDMSVFLGNSTLSEPGQLVSSDDYVNLIEGPSPPLTTTTTTISTIAPAGSDTSVQV